MLLIQWVFGHYICIYTVRCICFFGGKLWSFCLCTPPPQIKQLMCGWSADFQLWFNGFYKKKNQPNILSEIESIWAAGWLAVLWPYEGCFLVISFEIKQARLLKLNLTSPFNGALHMKFNFSASVGGWKPNINLSEKYQKTLGMFKTNIHPGRTSWTTPRGPKHYRRSNSVHLDVEFSLIQVTSLFSSDCRFPQPYKQYIFIIYE